MLPQLPNLDGLIGLANNKGVDIRPTLVRVLTDLYVQKPAHTKEEEHRYTELALWLLSAVDVNTRATVAKKLATYPAAPRSVIQRLARDTFKVAEPILLYSPCLSGAELRAISKECDSRYAAAIAARGQNRRPRPDLASESRSAPGVSKIFEAVWGIRNEPEAALGEVFLSASSAERGPLLAKLEHVASLSPPEPRPPVSQDLLESLEAAALAHRPEEFSRTLQRALHISAEIARRIVYDHRGEPVVIALKAVGMRADAVVRILLFLNPIVGRSVERVFSLAKLSDELSLEAALRLVASWRRLSPSETVAARHQPAHWDDETDRAARGLRDDRRTLPPLPSSRPQPVPSGTAVRRNQGTT
jgi:hypothetical protein